MGVQPFLIADTRIGVERDLEPWLLPNDAYPDLQNAYIWRGRVHKRLGFSLIGRLQRVVATLPMNDTTVTFTLLNIPLTAGLNSFSVTYGTFTVVFMDNGTGGFYQTDGGTFSTINYSTGQVTLVVEVSATVAAPVIYFPGLPVMGLRKLETLTPNEDSLVAFDTSFSYLFSGSVFTDLTYYKTSMAPFIWHGANYDLFWTNNYQRAMFTTNEVPGINGKAYQTLTAGATTTITITGSNVTANFVAGDYVFIYPNSSTTTFPMVGTVVEYQGSGSIASSTFTGGNTVIVVNVVTTTNSTTGTIFNQTRNIGNGTTVGDGIKWLDQDKSGWVNFQPPLYGAGTSTVYLQSCTMIFPYKNRLVVLNTQEGTFGGTINNFYQRARWSQNGSVYYSNPVPTNYTGLPDPLSWRSDVVGRGGHIDAPTLEQIISAEFVKDTLIVYFEESTWQLRYTGNEVLPFVWEKINTELGAQSTFSVIPFDKTTIALGDVGVHACDSVNVERIDAKIPDEIFNLQNINHGPQRITGIRDFFYELVYWSVPYTGISTILGAGFPSAAFSFPNKLIVYNYIDHSFSFFDDSFTCFGYYQATNAITWGSMTTFWSSQTALWSDPEIDDPYTVNTIAGNQQGYVELLMQQAENDQSLFIGNIIGSTFTVPNHNLQPFQYIKVLAASGMTSGVGAIFQVVTIIDANNFIIDIPLTGTFTGNGNLSVVPNVSILTKRFNPFIEQATQVRLNYADFYLERTTNAQISVNLFINEDSSSPINYFYNPDQLSTVSSIITAITATNPCVVTISSTIPIKVNDVVYITNVAGMTQINNFSAIVEAIDPTGLIITLSLDASSFSTYTAGGVLWDISQNTGNFINTFPESTYAASPDTKLVNAKLWKRLYFQDISQLFQFQITYSPIQMRCDQITSQPLVLHGVIMYFSQSGRLIDV